jgi:osmotically-inducible protein OsmY
VAVTDSWVTSKTKIALFADDRVKGSQVKVETKTASCILRGKVDSAEAKAGGHSVSQGHRRREVVKNDLQVVSPRRSQDRSTPRTQISPRRRDSACVSVK